MKLYIDSADPKEISQLAQSGLVDGVTTNPSLAAKTGLDYFDALRAICDTVLGPVSAEVLATDTKGMLEQGRAFSRIAKNIVVKVPLTWDGMKACQGFHAEGIKVNVTLCFSPVQAMIAAKSGASFISPFIGRVDDIGEDGMQLIREIKKIYANYEFTTKVLAASVRHVMHVREAALAGADISTVPPAVFKSLLNHPLTDKGLATFLEDAKKAGVKIRTE